METFRNWFKDLLPAIMVLGLSLIVQFYWSKAPDLDAWRLLYRVALRFFRYAAALCIPLYLLIPIYTAVIKKQSRILVQVEPLKDWTISPIRHWLFRPFQGIGISFLFATKLLALVHVISGPSADAAVPFTPGHLNLERILVAIAITILVSLLLSTFWTLDDVGVRYYNRRDQELKMIGKFVGTVVPIVLGLYGIFSIHAETSAESALIRVLRIVLALYPPLVVFAVAHTYFIRKRIPFFTERTGLTPGGVWLGQDKGEPRGTF